MTADVFPFGPLWLVVWYENRRRCETTVRARSSFEALLQASRQRAYDPRIISNATAVRL